MLIRSNLVIWTEGPFQNLPTDVYDAATSGPESEAFLRVHTAVFTWFPVLIALIMALCNGMLFPAHMHQSSSSILPVRKPEFASHPRYSHGFGDDKMCSLLTCAFV